MNSKNKEIQFGKGCLPDPIDERDHVFGSTTPILPISEEEWKKGYRVDLELGLKIPVKNQGSSSSCTGQAVSYYVGVLNFLELGEYIPVSAKAIYSQTNLGANNGGYIRDAIKLIVDWGEVYDSVVPSIKKDGSCDEPFMIDRSWKNEKIDEIAKMLRSKDYQSIVGYDIETFAAAIKQNNGVVSGVTGTNNGTWTSLVPTIPGLDTSNSKLWGHAIYFGGYGIDEKGKFIWILNSWGENVGDKGWQKLYGEWFGAYGRWIFNPWTLTDKPNENMTYKKLKTDPSVWFCNEELKTRLMIVDFPTLSAMNGGKFEEVDSLEEYKIIGTIVTVERVIN